MFRVGHGYDVHKLVFNRRLILCGEPIPFKKGLLGHSDADVATHALIDSLLGAAGLQDIGTHFKDTDEKFKDISSLILLKEVVLMLKKNNFLISNVDLTIVAKFPKIMPFSEKMKTNLEGVLKIPKNLINMKAQTEEGVGICKPNKAIAAFCSSLIYKNSTN